MTARDNNRAAFPATAALVDELRGIFGADVRLEWAEENGRTIGKKGPDGVRACPEHKPGQIKQHDRNGRDGD